jgi:transketolase
LSESTVRHDDLANAIRALSMDAVEKAKSGHPGLPMGMADVATVLFTKYLKFDPAQPLWPDRDRFVHSAGHGSMLLYALLYLTGYPDMTIEEIKRFRALGSRTAGHPEYGHAFGIETTTGPLGQGVATSVGMALAERHLAARFGAELVDHRTFVICSDGDLEEGISHEGCSFAGHYRLNKLTLLYDDNGISIDGPTSLSFSDDVLRRFEGYHWNTARVDGQDAAAVDRAIAASMDSDRPTIIACKTTIGYGAPTKAGTEKAHGSALGEKEIEGARKNLHWPYPPFEVPEPILSAWRAYGRRGAEASATWRQRLESVDDKKRAEFEAFLAGDYSRDARAKLEEHKRKLSAERPKMATRKSSQAALEVLTEAIPSMVGGSADLTHSNNTDTKATKDMHPGDYAGRYVRYGIREHGMVAAMNGMAVHGGIIPYGGTFLVFTDYCRPSIRLAALMRQRVIVVGTHDSIGLGEDGPTHQPVEHLASLRAIPGLLVLRPADAVEAAECWELALEHKDQPSVLSLTRQDLPTLRTEHTSENLCARGAYVVSDARGQRRATILATGSEVPIAVAAQASLREAGVETAVVSMPCWELFDRQDPAYRAGVLGSAPRVAVEAASPFGWTRYIASEDHFVGMRSFGASGPYEEVYEHFGITPEAVVGKVKDVLG